MADQERQALKDLALIATMCLELMRSEHDDRDNDEYRDCMRCWMQRNLAKAIERADAILLPA